MAASAAIVLALGPFGLVFQALRHGLSGSTAVLENLRAGFLTVNHIPPILPLAHDWRRPLFSVMLPTYQPTDSLRRALESVLVQAPGPDVMQIAVVDDASTASSTRELVRSIDPTGRVELILSSDRLGLASNWNRATALSRGHLVHLLHQDDFVFPGFYSRMEQAFRADRRIGMAFCRSRIVNASEDTIKTSSRLRWLPGVMSDWIATIGERQRLQTPGAVVARTTYETLGGYRSDLCHAVDWEMWVRIAAQFPVWHEPAVLAAYRRHDANESSRLFSSGAIWPDLVHAIQINAGSFPPEMKTAIVHRSARWYAGSALRTAAKQLEQGERVQAHATLACIPALRSMMSSASHSEAIGHRASLLQQRLNSGSTGLHAA